MQNIEVCRESQEIKPLQTCESYFVNFPHKNVVSQLGYKIFLTKTVLGSWLIILQTAPLSGAVQVDTRFYQDTDV